MIPTIFVPNEVRGGEPLPPNFTAEAIKHLHKSGIVVLANAVPTTDLDALYAELAPKAASLAKAPGQQHFNFGRHTGNVSQGPPLDDTSLLFRDVWANPVVVSVLAAALGPEPVLQRVCGNTALQAAVTGGQPVHSDIDFAHPNFPFSYVVNVPLVDMTESNGATEVWVGSHNATSFGDQVHGPLLGPDQRSQELPARAILPQLIERRCALSPPVRACTQKGSLIIRDLRLWHAGRPNLTPNPRVMLAFVWQAAWWCGRGRIRLPHASRPIFDVWKKEAVVPFRIAARWVDEAVEPQVNGQADVESSLESSDNELMRMFAGEYRVPSLVSKL
jgi:hypothetical protein